MTNEDEATCKSCGRGMAEHHGHPLRCPDRPPRDSLTALHADLLAGMVDGNTAALRLEALMDEIAEEAKSQATCTLPAVSDPADVERDEPMPPLYAEVADHIPALRRALTDNEEDA